MIQVAFIPDGQTERTILARLEPDKTASFYDYSTGKKRAIAALCYADDSGGEVYFFDTPEVPTSFSRRAAAHPRPGALDTRMQRILHGGEYKRHIRTNMYRRGDLVLTHVAGHHTAKKT